MLTRERLRSFLHSCFHSSDDVFLESMTSRTKANADHMWRMPNDVAHPGRMDRAMLNFIINILIGSGDTPLTFAAANKRYSLHCLLLRKYMQMGDHHTAILLYQAMESPIIKRVKFFTPSSRSRVFKDCRERYGTLTDSFRIHLDDIVNDRLDYNEVASLLVCLIHKKKLSEYRKLVRKTSSVENVLLQRFECFEGWTEYEDWMDFYIDEPLQEIAERTKESLQGTINQQLFSIANKIQRRKSI